MAPNTNERQVESSGSNPIQPLRITLSHQRTNINRGMREEWPQPSLRMSFFVPVNPNPQFVTTLRPGMVNSAPILLQLARIMGESSRPVLAAIIAPRPVRSSIPYQGHIAAAPLALRPAVSNVPNYRPNSYLANQHHQYQMGVQYAYFSEYMYTIPSGFMYPGIELGPAPIYQNQGSRDPPIRPEPQP